MFVINPDPYSLPAYLIGPFGTGDVSRNHLLPDSDRIDGYMDIRFAGKAFEYTINGRQAMDLALASLDLQKEDLVTILTTSGNFYISGCVTDTIERYCRWNREMTAETKAIFVNHEFGYPFAGLRELKAHGLPIIEDCASSFFSYDQANDTGNVGDFVIYSFPKMFPLQIGGLLVSNRPDSGVGKNDNLGKEELRHIKNVLSAHIDQKDRIIQKRISNYNYLRDKFASLGYSERFRQEPGAIPGVFMFRTQGHQLDLPKMKTYFWAHGIQCSVFYGEEAFFIPVHQALNEQDLDYFVSVFKSFIR
jgi:hypothetical protein